MGFFSDMGSIRKVYKLLGAIESEMLDYLLHAVSWQYVLSNYDSLQMDEMRLRSKVRELVQIYQQGNKTIQYADFQFKGGSYRLYQIIDMLNDEIGRASKQIESYHNS